MAPRSYGKPNVPKLHNTISLHNKCRFYQTRRHHDVPDVIMTFPMSSWHSRCNHDVPNAIMPFPTSSWRSQRHHDVHGRGIVHAQFPSRHIGLLKVIMTWYICGFTTHLDSKHYVGGLHCMCGVWMLFRFSQEVLITTKFSNSLKILLKKVLQVKLNVFK